MGLDSGTMVTANVRLLSPIGEGAMGSVWLAEHLTLETEVAVKFILDKVPNHEDAVTRFKREAAVAAKIRSPHIVQVFDQGLMGDGTPYIVMELLEGESLDVRLERVRRLTMRQTAQVVSQVAKGLRAAHKVGIVHRDVKPANIFLVPTDEGKLIKLVDFGVAKTTRMPEARKLTQDGLLIGTPEYISRDQIVSGASADHHADLWALAVVAYECLVGEVPFGGSTIGMVCANIVAGDYVLPSKVRDDLPVALDRWFEKCFANEPSKRFFSARDMALAFVRAVPTRVTDIEADLLESGQARFSSPPKAIRRGTKVGVAAVERELMLGDDELEDDLEGDEDDDRSRTLSDWGDVLEGDDSMELALEPTTPAPPVVPSRPSARPSRRVLEVVDELEEGASPLPDALASTDTDEPLPVRKLRVDLFGAGIAALAVAGAGIWFAMRPSSTTAAPEPGKPTVVAPTELASVSSDRAKAAAPNVLAASPPAELAPGAAAALVTSAPSSSAIATAAAAATAAAPAVVPSAAAQPPVAKGAGKTGASAPQPAGGSPKSTNHEDLGF